MEASSLTHHINSIGSLTVTIQLNHKHSKQVQIEIIIIKLDNPPICPIILGLFTYAIFDLTLSFQTINKEKVPVLHTQNRNRVKHF